MPRPFRLLHTSDWHLGAAFHQQDRRADEEAAIAALVGHCQAHAVDAVAIAGDIFDTANPAAETQQRYYRALLALVHEGGVGSVVVIGGNHDSAGRLDAPREVLEACQVFVRGSLPREADPAEVVVALDGRDGAPGILALAMPYLREVDLDLAPGPEDLASRQARAMEARFKEANAAAQALAQERKLPLVALAHCFASAGVLGGAERPVVGETVGNLGQVAPGALAEGCAYLGLGHLHRPQAVGGKAHWRYCGSLLPMGFDQDGGHRVACLVTIEGTGPATVEELVLPCHRPYADIHGDAPAVEASLRNLPLRPAGAPPGFLRATVELDLPRPGFADEVARLAADRGWIPLLVQRRDTGLGLAAALGDGGTAAVETLAEFAPEAVLDQAWRRKYGEQPLPDDLLLAFRELERGVLAKEGA